MSSESIDEAAAAKLLAAVFCSACGIDYTPLPSSSVCPRCGRVPHGPGSLSTFISSNPQTKEAPRASGSTELDRWIGERFAGYRIEGFLGAGAMGRVYLARHLALHRSCAIKMLPPELVEADPGFLSRFRNEGRAAAALVHPNVVTVHAVGEFAGCHYIEMEFVAGLSLGGLLRREGAQSPVRSTALTLKVAEGLAAAHAHGYLHRDLKPENVLLSYQDVPKITDFGLARRTIIHDGDRSPQEIAGTLGFLAPEVLLGQPATARSDVYSLGMVYYSMLTGQSPAEGLSASRIVAQTLNGDYPTARQLVPTLPLEFAECLSQLVSVVPEHRPESAVEAASMLRAVLGEQQDLSDLVERAFRHVPGVTWTRQGDRFEIVLRLPEGRQQKAMVQPSTRAAADQLVTISSVCGPARADYFETALRLNAELLHGALAIQTIDGEHAFVVLDTYPRATIDPEEIRRSTLEAAQKADAIEKLLTGGDRH